MIYSVKSAVNPNSGIWLCDSDGLKYLENYYSSYGPTFVNRWHEFEVKSVDPIVNIDFGGACFANVPMVEAEAMGICFRFLSHQAMCVHEVLEEGPYKGSNVRSFNGRWEYVVIGKEIRDELLKICNSKISLWNDEYDNFIRENFNDTNK